MKHLSAIWMVLLLLLAITTTSCGNKPPDSSIISDDTAANSINDTNTKITDADATTAQPAEPATGNGEKKVLTVSQCWDFYYTEEAAKKYMDIHPDVDIRVTKYDNDYERYGAQVATALMAGTADDLLDGMGIDYRNASTVKLLTDFYPVMQADPSFNENDYYMNVFKALEFQGGLYTFPTSFSYNLLTVNRQVSEELITAYESYPNISSFDLLSIYNSVPGANEYYLNDGFDVITALTSVIDSFIDFDKNTCDFNNEKFINFITNAKAATEPNKMYGYTYSRNVYEPKDEKEFGLKYLFMSTNSTVYQYFMDFLSDTQFSGLIPATNESGLLQMSPLKNFCISAQSPNKDLAWDFISFMVSTEANDYNNGYVFVPDIPVYKPLFRYKMEMELPTWINHFEENFDWRVKGSAEEQIQSVIQKMETFNNMPMINFSTNLYSIISEVIERFHNGTITAEQCASELQNKVSLALME